MHFSLTYLYKNVCWKQRDIIFKEKTRMKPHANYYKSLHSMKVGFVSYAWNFSWNIMHLKYSYIIKFENAVVLNMEKRLSYSVTSYENYNKLYQILPQEAVIQNIAWLVWDCFLRLILWKWNWQLWKVCMWFTYKAINNSDNIECTSWWTEKNLERNSYGLRYYSSIFLEDYANQNAQSE